MSSLTVRSEPWAAFPNDDTTVRQLALAMTQFDLELLVDDRLVVSLVQAVGTDQEPPSADELAAVLYGDEADYIIEDQSGVYELPDFGAAAAFEAEARDRHHEDDQDLV